MVFSFIYIEYYLACCILGWFRRQNPVLLKRQVDIVAEAYQHHRLIHLAPVKKKHKKKTIRFEMKKII